MHLVAFGRNVISLMYCIENRGLEQNRAQSAFVASLDLYALAV